MSAGIASANPPRSSLPASGAAVTHKLLAEPPEQKAANCGTGHCLVHLHSPGAHRDVTPPAAAAARDAACPCLRGSGQLRQRRRAAALSSAGAGEAVVSEGFSSQTGAEGKDVPARGVFKNSSTDCTEHPPGCPLQRGPQGTWSLEVLGSWEMGCHCAVRGKAVPGVLRAPVRVLQGLTLTWAVASAQRLPRRPAMQRPWGQCQRWDGVLLPGSLPQACPGWLLGGESAAGGEAWSVGG